MPILCGLFSLLLDVSRYLGMISTPLKGYRTVPTFPLRFFSRLYWQTYSSSFRASVSRSRREPNVVVVRTNTSRTRRLAVTSCAHPVAVVASSTDSTFDRRRAFALWFVHINRGCLHCGDVERIFVFEWRVEDGNIRGRLGSVMRYLGKHRCGQAQMWASIRTYTCRGTTSDLMNLVGDGPLPGSGSVA